MYIYIYILRTTDFEIILDLQKSYPNSRKSFYIPFPQLFLMLRAYVTMSHAQNQDINTGTIPRPKL